MIVGFGHHSRVGKDTAAAHLGATYGFARLAFADPVRDLAYRLNPWVASDVDRHGWDRAKEQGYVRAFLDDVGTGCRHVLGDDIFLDRVLARIDAEPSRRWVVTDVRQPNEYDALTARGALLVDIVNPRVEPSTHPLHAALDGAPWPVVIHNDGDIDCFLARIDALAQDLLALSAS